MDRRENRIINLTIPWIWRKVTNQTMACSTCWALLNFELARMRLLSLMQTFCHQSPLGHTAPSSPYSLLQSEYSHHQKRTTSERDEVIGSDYRPQTKKPPQPHQRSWCHNVLYRAFVKTQAVELFIWICASRRFEKALPVTFSSFLICQYGLWFYHNVTDLFEAIGIACNLIERCLVIDTSSRSLKVLLLHNGNLYSSLHLAYSVQLKMI